MRPTVRQHRNPVGEVLGALHHLKDVVAHPHDRQMLVHVQVAVASNAQVPTPAVSGEAVDQLMLAIHPVRRFVDLDFRPPVLEPAGHHHGPPQRGGGRAHLAVPRQRLSRVGQPKRAVRHSLQVQRESIGPPNPSHPIHAASLDRPFRLTFDPALEGLRKLHAGDPGEHWRVLDLDRLRPVGPPPPAAHLAGVQQQKVSHLVRRAHRRLRPRWPGADNQHIEHLAHATCPRCPSRRLRALASAPIPLPP